MAEELVTGGGGEIKGGFGIEEEEELMAEELVTGGGGEIKGGFGIEEEEEEDACVCCGFTGGAMTLPLIKVNLEGVIN